MPDFSLEKGYGGIVAGVDEVGRGSWAGPVVAAAVIIDHKRIAKSTISQVDDSKKLTQQKRESICELIINDPGYIWAIGEASVAEIDKFNIREALFLAMKRAVEGLAINPELALIDGNACPEMHVSTQAVIKGDNVSYSIAAASVVAKVYRDRYMQRLAKSFPGYGWERNSGYGTKEHREALQLLGITSHHRKSYAPIRELLAG